MFRELSLVLKIALPTLILSLLPALASGQVSQRATHGERAATLDEQSAASGRNEKIGVINFQAALTNTAEGKKTMRDLQKKYAPQQAEIERLQKEIQISQEQLSREQATLSEDEQSQLGQELEVKQRSVKRTTEDAQNDFNRDRDMAANRIGQKMVRLIGEYASQNGFELILDDAQVPVYFASPRIDVTKEIIARYDEANPVVDAEAAPGHSAVK